MGLFLLKQGREPKLSLYLLLESGWGGSSVAMFLMFKLFIYLHLIARESHCS